MILWCLQGCLLALASSSRFVALSARDRFASRWILLECIRRVASSSCRSIPASGICRSEGSEFWAWRSNYRRFCTFGSCRGLDGLGYGTMEAFTNALISFIFNQRSYRFDQTRLSIQWVPEFAFVFGRWGTYWEWCANFRHFQLIHPEYRRDRSGDEFDKWVKCLPPRSHE